MLKPIEPQSSVSVVWHMDPAVKKYPEDYLSKCSTNPGCWQEELKLKDGQKPTRFVIGVIPPSDLVRAEDDARWPGKDFRPHSLFWSCFVAGLRDIKDFGPGKVPKITVNGVEYVDPDWLEENFCGGLRMCALFIGQVVWSWNNATADDEKNS